MVYFDFFQSPHGIVHKYDYNRHEPFLWLLFSLIFTIPTNTVAILILQIILFIPLYQYGTKNITVGMNVRKFLDKKNA